MHKPTKVLLFPSPFQIPIWMSYVQFTNIYSKVIDMFWWFGHTHTPIESYHLAKPTCTLLINTEHVWLKVNRFADRNKNLSLECTTLTARDSKLNTQGFVSYPLRKLVSSLWSTLRLTSIVKELNGAILTSTIREEISFFILWNIFSPLASHLNLFFLWGAQRKALLSLQA